MHYSTGGRERKCEKETKPGNLPFHKKKFGPPPSIASASSILVLHLGRSNGAHKPFCPLGYSADF